ncbi:MAG: MG2 domain-containing protein [Candidatus Polarisedimenticolia bacterium]
MKVVAARPTGQVRGKAQIAIVFSKPMVALSDAEAAAAQGEPARIVPDLAGEWRWIGSATLEFAPKARLPRATAFTVEVPAGLKALDGSVLRAPYRFTFNTARPEITDISPSTGFPWLAPDQTFRVSANQPLRDLARHARLLVGAEGRPVALRVAREALALQDELDEEKRTDPQSRRIAVWAEEIESGRDVRTNYDLRADERLPLNAEVRFVVDGDLRATEGNLTLEKPFEVSYRTFGAMRFFGPEPGVNETVPPWGRITLRVSNEPDLASLRARFRIDPPVAVDWDKAQTQTTTPDKGSTRREAIVQLPANLATGTSYTISIAAGVRDQAGQTAPAFVSRFTTTDYPALVQLDRGKWLVAAGPDGAFRVRTLNIPMLRAKVWTLAPNELGMAAEESATGRSWRPDRKPREIVVATHSRKNVFRWIPIDVRRLLPPGRTDGFVLMRFDVAPSFHGATEALVQLSHLAVHAKLGAASSLVYVTDLATGAPVAGAAVDVYEGGTPRLAGVTDAAGVALLPGLASPRTDMEHGFRARPLAVVARKGGQSGATVTGMGDDLPQEVSDDRDVLMDRKEPRGYVFTDRGVYRPGEEVDVVGVLRVRDARGLRTPAGIAAKIEVLDPRGETIASRETTTTRFGTLSARVPLSREAPLGGYDVRVSFEVDGQTVTDGGGFGVAEYRAPQFRVLARARKASVLARESLAADFDARQLFGAPMPEAPVSWTVRCGPAEFVPPGHDDYVFGPNTGYWDDDGASGSCFLEGKGRTDAAGRFALEAATAEETHGRASRRIVEAEVANADRQRVAARTSILVHPAAAYAGIRAPAGFAAAGRPLAVGLIAVSPEGAPLSGLPITLTASLRTSDAVRTRRQDGGWTTTYKTRETEVGRCATTSTPDERTCEFTFAAAGVYVLRATVADAAGRTQTTSMSLSATGARASRPNAGDERELALRTERPNYAPGETARIVVENPWPEADGLLTIEREGIIAERPIHLVGAAPVLEVPVTEAMAPNVFVSVLLTPDRRRAAGRDEDVAGPLVRAGSVPLDIDLKIKRLAVVVKSDAPEKKPRQKTTLELQVNDWRGVGVPAELEVWAVDEGVLNLTDHRPQDPVEIFNLSAGLRVRTLSSLRALNLRRRDGDDDESPSLTLRPRRPTISRTATATAMAMPLVVSGEGDPSVPETSPAADVRRLFKTTPLFAPHVTTDERGRATVSFDLPDNVTTYRVFAVAVDETDRAGLGETKVVVSKPLLAMPALPRFARVGDEFEAGVVVHAPKAAARAVAVRAEAEGLTLVGAATRTVELPEGRPREVRFKFAAEKPGTATLRFFVEGGGEKDAVEQKLPVDVAAALETVAAYGDTGGRRAEALAAPRDARPDAGGLTVTLASSAIGGYAEAMRQLVEYPFGCVEQLSSRLIPFVALGDLQRAFGVAPTTDREALARAEELDALYARIFGQPSPASAGDAPDAVARRAIERISALQTYAGGFRYWPSSTCPSYDGSSYAFLALARAKKAGYAVRDDVLENARSFLAKSVAAGRPKRCRGKETAVSLGERVFAVWALHRGGKPAPATYDALYAQRAELPLYAKAMLADAMIGGGGDAARGKGLLGEVLGAARETAGEVHFEESAEDSAWSFWSSPTRTTAIALMIMADVEPDHPYVGKAARWLAAARDRKGQYRTTQESAFALMALTELLRTKEKAVPDFAADVSLGGASLAREAFRGRSLDARRIERPIGEVLSLPAETPLVFSKRGAGVLYYSASLRYAPTKIDLAPLDRGIIVQRSIEAWDGAAETAFKAGDLLRLRLRIETPAERRFVVVSAPIPAGLEVVDPSFATTAKPDDDDGYGDDGLLRWPLWWVWSHKELRDDRVLAFADELPAGMHTLTVALRATTAGTFLLPPARAEEMYAPEVFGRSEGGVFTVAPPAD